MSLVSPPAMHSLGSNSYNARTDRRIVEALLGGAGHEGVIRPGDFKVTPTSPASMSVQVAAGLAAIDGDNVARQGVYIAENDGAVNVGPFTAPGSGLQRIDLVVLRDFDQSPDGGSAGSDQQTLAIVQGTPLASNPVPPAVPSSALVLAQVLLTNATTSIAASAITDRRRRAHAGLARPAARAFASAVSVATGNGAGNATASFASPTGLAYDVDGMWSSSTPNRLTVRTPGIYRVTGHVAWGDQANNAGRRRFLIVHVTAAGVGVQTAEGRAFPDGITRTYQMTAEDWLVAEGDYFQLQLGQDSGSTLTADVRLSAVLLADGGL